MKNKLFLSIILLFGAVSLLFPLVSQAQNPTEPQEMYLSVSTPKPPGQTGLRRPQGDGNVWTFRVVLAPGLRWHTGPNWSYPGKGNGVDPAWGQWTAGDGYPWLSWISPEIAAPFSIRMTGKVVGTSGGGGGAPIDVEASWDGEVEVVKTWTTGGAIAASLTAPSSGLKVAPKTEVVCSVTASDTDHWTTDTGEGDEADELTYKWSASGGFIRGSGPSVMYIPPDETGIYTITCEVNDLPTSIAYPDKGTRDDAKVTLTTTVEVPPRHWSAGETIGKMLDDKGEPLMKDGVQVENGRLIAPQDRTKPLPPGLTQWPAVRVRPGDEISFGVESATDWDHWTRIDLAPETLENHGTVHGDEEDELTYTWSGGGSFKNGRNTGQSVTWTAPAIDPNGTNTYTIKCAIDDKPTAVETPATGSRDDTALERTVVVHVVDDESWAKLSVHKDDNGTPEEEAASGVVGGKVWVALEIQVGGQSKISSPTGAAWVRIEEQEGEGLHDEATNHAYLAVPLGTAGAWEKWNTVTDEWDATTDIPITVNAGNTPVRYRWVAPWQTTTSLNSSDPDTEGPLTAGTLLGHNAPHGLTFNYVVDGAVKTEMEFATKDENGDYEEPRASGPNVVGIEIGNLVVENGRSNNGTLDYFKWDSENPDLASPIISFSIRDDGEPQKYKWTIWFKETSAMHADASVDWREGAYKVSGISPTVGDVTVDLTDISLVGHLDPFVHRRGPYTYDIRVVKYVGNIPPDENESTAIDKAQLKQPYVIWIPYQFVSNGNSQSGHNVWFKRISSETSTSSDEYYDPSEENEMSSNDTFTDIDGVILPGILQHNEDEDEIIQIRAKYYLYPNPLIDSASADTIEMITLDPNLIERGQVSGKTSAGILHDGNDEDQDGIKDGYLVYTFKPEDESGLWRIIFVGSESAGAKLRRNHSSARLMPVNQKIGNSKLAPLDFPRLRQMYYAEPETHDSRIPWYFDIGRKFELSIGAASNSTLNGTGYVSRARAIRMTPPPLPLTRPLGTTIPDIVREVITSRIDPFAPGGVRVRTYSESHFAEIKSTTSHQITSSSYNYQILGEIDIAAHSSIVGSGYRPMFTLITPSRTSINSPNIRDTCRTISSLTEVNAQHFRVYEITPPQGLYRDNLYIGKPRILNGQQTIRGPFLRGTDHFP